MSLVEVLAAASGVVDDGPAGELLLEQAGSTRPPAATMTEARRIEGMGRPSERGERSDERRATSDEIRGSDSLTLDTNAMIARPYGRARGLLQNEIGVRVDDARFEASARHGRRGDPFRARTSPANSASPLSAALTAKV
jgi:hypothetical protein